MEEIRTRKNEIIKVIVELGAKIEAMKEEKSGLSAALDAAKAETEQLRRDLAAAEEDRKGLNTRIETHQRQIETLQSELKSSKDSFDEIFGALQDVNRTIRKMAME